MLNQVLLFKCSYNTLLPVVEDSVWTVRLTEHKPTSAIDGTLSHLQLLMVVYPCRIYSNPSVHHTNMAETKPPF